MAGLLGDECRKHGCHPVEHALDVDVDHQMPVVGLHRGKGRVGHDAGIEEYDVHATEAVDGVLDDRFA